MDQDWRGRLLRESWKLATRYDGTYINDDIVWTYSYFTLVQANDLFLTAIATALHVSTFRIYVPMPQKLTKVCFC